MMSRLPVLFAGVLVIVACNQRTDINGPGVVATADISGKWGGRGDGASSADSLTVTFSQHANDSLSGGGVYWQASSPTPVKIVGARVKDSLYVALPDSSGSTPDTLEFIGIVTKDAFGDELVGVVGHGPFNAVTGATFALHRRP